MDSESKGAHGGLRVLGDWARWVMRQRGKRRVGGLPGLVLVLLVGGGMAGGCGVKGPPTPLWPPAPLPAVSDLAYRMADRQVTLTWRLHAPLDRQTAGQASFIVRRSQIELDGPACENCPLVFETVRRVPYVEAPDGVYTSTLNLSTGYRYVFTVHLKMGNLIGADSNPVKFDYPSNDVVMPVEEP